MSGARVAAVTGASRGIGLAIARLLASKGWVVYNLSRRPAETDGIRDIATDVTDEEAVARAMAQIEAECRRLDLLVNNAGFGIAGAAEFTKLEDARRQFDVNFFGVLACIKAALPLLKTTRGRIINISSAAAVFAIPFQSFYSATKASVNILTNALANELKPFGVSICALQLGDVRTEFTSARVTSLEGNEVYGGAISRSIAVMERDEQNGMTPEYIAAQVYKIARKKRVKPLYTIGLKYKLFVFLNKLLPNSFVNYVVGKMYVK
ncbi:MAG: SDR family NAD(P)-dependent oxidoreductase [Firmicutes bacterium]|nr:SDR family NAD(P)-dependent oxidoreductase [Bacillota bacterium]HOB34326.1 SDR family NAD(P)-dependent oxidoreductase [Bacillota bacterium]HPZ90667.1 SDR family NAD(P)-dependent oxidoreductase [Bacillota bacterium]HQE01537.1 SDR family NAD(P)-dependent oxidoreductase [Bacillota bacterium]